LAHLNAEKRKTFKRWKANPAGFALLQWEFDLLIPALTSKHVVR
jgi:hypothetical protein